MNRRRFFGVVAAGPVALTAAPAQAVRVTARFDAEPLVAAVRSGLAIIEAQQKEAERAAALIQQSIDRSLDEMAKSGGARAGLPRASTAVLVYSPPAEPTA